MTTDPIDRVFGRGRLKMATGAHVEVFREAAAPGESRRYTKRFLTTADGDYAQWTEREWRILARLIGHGSRSVPEIVQYDRDARGTKLVQTYDAGATVDQWATLLPVARDGRVHAHVFEDCAHWWALAHHCLAALDEIHTLGLVHLDVKGDNVCIPIGPPDFDWQDADGKLFPVFRKLALIDFAFSLVSGETLATALPIGWQQDYDYQSPRLLQALDAGRAGDLRPTERLDWRCDMYSLAAMLKRYLPRDAILYDVDQAHGWTPERYDAAKALILRIRDSHDRAAGAPPHVELMLETSAHLASDELSRSLEQGWTLALDVPARAASTLPLTPVTRLAPPLRIVVPPREDHDLAIPTTIVVPLRTASAVDGPRSRAWRAPAIAASLVLALAAVLALAWNEGTLQDAMQRLVEAARSGVASLRDRESGDAATQVAAAAEEPAFAPSIASEPPSEAPSSTDASSRASAASGDALADRALRAAPAPSSPGAQIEAHRTKPIARGTARSSPAPRSRTSRTDDGKRAVASVAPKAQRASVVAQRSVPAAAKRPPLAPSVASRSPPSTSLAAVASTQPPVTIAAVATPAPASTPTSEPAPPASPSSAVTPNPAPPVHAPAVATLAPPPAPSSARIPAPAPATIAPPPAPSSARPPSAPAAATPGHAPIVDASRQLASAPLPAPRLSGGATVSEPARVAIRPPESAGDDALAVHARVLMNDALPRSAAQSHARVARVLAMAANAWHPAHEASLASAAVGVGGASEPVAATIAAGAGQARRLHEQARQAYRMRRHIPEALDHALGAFAADPNDPDIASHAAFLHLRVLPAQPERARQFALHALGGRAAFDAGARVDDWVTFAIASALTGRAADARNAFFTVLALSRDAERSCRLGVHAHAVHGERLREPVEALVDRVRIQGRAGELGGCKPPAARVAIWR